MTDTKPSPTSPGIDLDEVARLVDALEHDLAEARTDASRIAALRAEVEQLCATLGAGEAGAADVETEQGVRERLHRLGDALVSDAFEGSQYISQIGRILGM